MSHVNVTVPTTTLDSSPFQSFTKGSTLTYILWGASAFAIVLLAVRLIIVIVKRARRRYQSSPPVLGASTYQLYDPPPRYSDLSIHTLPPSYSQACRLIHYHSTVLPNGSQVPGSPTSVINNINSNPVSSPATVSIDISRTGSDNAPTRSSNYYTNESFGNDESDDEFEADFTVRQYSIQQVEGSANDDNDLQSHNTSENDASETSTL